jgi:hypothetical protein
MKDSGEGFVVCNNRIVGAADGFGDSRSSLGKAGIWINIDDTQNPGWQPPALVPCEIEGNRIYDFWTGIVLDRLAGQSIVRGNHIARDIGIDYNKKWSGSRPAGFSALQAYLDQNLDPTYAIDINAPGSVVQENEIQLPLGSGGIRVRAREVRVLDNVLAADDFGPDRLLPVGIYCTKAENAGDSGADDCEVLDNVLTGPQAGIVASRVRGTRLRGNRIDNDGSAG